MAVKERAAPGAARRQAHGAGKEALHRGRLRSPLKAASHEGPPLTQDELRELRQWLASIAALRPDRARCLLDRAIDHRQLVDEPALHWRAVKARIAGDGNWPPMGFRLALD